MTRQEEVNKRFEKWFKKYGEYYFQSGTNVLAFVFSEIDLREKEIVEGIMGKMDEYEYHKDEIHCACLGALREFIKESLITKDK